MRLETARLEKSDAVTFLSEQLGYAVRADHMQCPHCYEYASTLAEQAIDSLRHGNIAFGQKSVAKLCCRKIRLIYKEFVFITVQ